MLYVRNPSMLLLVFIFLSCNSTNKNQVSSDTTNTKISIDTSQNLKDPDLLSLITNRKSLPASLVKKYLDFSTTYVDSMSNITTFSSQKYSDSLLIAFIDFNNGGSCGERYIVTLQTPEIKQVAKLRTTTYCDSDEVENNHKLDYIYKSDSTFETDDIYYGQGKRMKNGRNTNRIHKREWHIQPNGSIVLIRETDEDDL